MKKSLIIISAVIVLLSAVLTSCGKADTFVDNSGNKHILVTDGKGNPVRDEYGNLFERVTENGKQVTKYYRFPELVTNKRNTKIENSLFEVDVPKGWETSGLKSIMRICHKGKCRDLYQTDCQIEFSVNTRTDVESACGEYLNGIKQLQSMGGSLSGIKESETTLFEKKVKVVSYRMDETGATALYYCIAQGKAVAEIRATVFDSCYSQAEIEELINSCCTLKPVGTAPAADGK